MPRQEFEAVVAQAPRKQMVRCSNTQAAPIAANGGTEQIDIYSPAGTMSVVINANMQAPAPAGATTGTHFIQLSPVNIGIQVRGTSNFGDMVSYDGCEWISATNKKQPSTDTLRAVQTSYFDSVNPLSVIYKNSTDAVQNGARSYGFVFLQESLATG